MDKSVSRNIRCKNVLLNSLGPEKGNPQENVLYLASYSHCAVAIFKHLVAWWLVKNFLKKKMSPGNGGTCL